MYISKLTFDNDSVRARRLIVSPYRVHKAVMCAFPDAKDGGAGRVLFRVDRSDELGVNILLVQSEKEPDWQSAEWLVGCLSEPPQTKPLRLVFARGQVLYYRLLANPTVKRRTKDGLPTKRLGLLREQDQLAWLNGKAERGGFSLLSCAATANEMLKETKDAGGNRHSLSLLSVCFEGVLKVDNPESFVETVRRGIGSAKGLGFGLLSLAPLAK